VELDVCLFAECNLKRPRSAIFSWEGKRKKQFDPSDMMTHSLSLGRLGRKKFLGFKTRALAFFSPKRPPFFLSRTGAALSPEKRQGAGRKQSHYSDSTAQKEDLASLLPFRERRGNQKMAGLPMGFFFFFNWRHGR